MESCPHRPHQYFLWSFIREFSSICWIFFWNRGWEGVIRTSNLLVYVRSLESFTSILWSVFLSYFDWKHLDFDGFITNLHVLLSVHLSVLLSICLFVFFCLSVFFYVELLIPSFGFLSVCLSVFIFVCLLIPSSFFPSICLHVFLFF